MSSNRSVMFIFYVRLLRCLCADAKDSSSRHEYLFLIGAGTGCNTAEGHLDHGGAGLKPLIGGCLMRDDLIFISVQT